MVNTRDIWIDCGIKFERERVLKFINEDLKEVNKEFDKKRPFCWKDLSEEKKIEWTEILTKKRLLEGLKETFGGSQ